MENHIITNAIDPNAFDTDAIDTDAIDTDVIVADVIDNKTIDTDAVAVDAIDADAAAARMIDDVTPAADARHRGATEGAIQHVWANGRWRKLVRPFVREAPLTIYVDQVELVTLLCTPAKLNSLVVGFVVLEGIAAGLDDIALLRVCDDERVAEVRLARSSFSPPSRRTLTSGCGGGVSFAPEGLKLARVESAATVSGAAIQGLMKQLQAHATLYRLSGGVHTSALAEPERLIVVAEDVGRHNTLDKIYGECLLKEIRSEGCLLLTTGRVSSEMVLKAVKMRSEIVVSRTAVTDEAIRLANEFNVTLIGYARGARMTVYTHPWRVNDFVPGA